MWKLVFATIIICAVLGTAFFVGFVLGTTVSPLNATAAAEAVAQSGARHG